MQLQNRDFTLISNDCWGTEVYKYFDLPWNTPFIGLLVMPEDYLNLLQDPKHYLTGELRFLETSRHDAINRLRAKNPFPIGLVGADIEIQFLHYHSHEEAQAKWSRRCARINWQNLRVKFDGSKDGATPELVSQFDQLPYQKLTLLQEPIVGISSALVVQRYTPDGMQQFYASILDFSLAKWLNADPG